MGIAHSGMILPIKTCFPADDKTIFLAHYDVTQDESLSGITPISGVSTLRRFEGKFGGGLAVEAGTENLLDTQGNNVSQDWSKWSHYNNATYWKQATRTQYDDPIMGKVFRGQNATDLATAFLFLYYPLSFTKDSSYARSIYLKSDIPLDDVRVELYLNSNAGGQHQVTDQTGVTTQGISTDWKRFESVNPSKETISGTGGFGVAIRNLPAAATIHAAMPQVEEKTYPTSFTQGIRGIANVEYPLLIEGDFTAFLYIKGYKVTNTIRRFLTFKRPGKPNLSVFNGWTDDWGFMLDSTIQYSYGGVPTPSEAYSEYALALRRQGNKMTVTIFHEGRKYDISNTNDNYLGAITSFFLSPFTNMIYDELRIDKVARTDEELIAWYGSQSPFYPRGIHRVYS